MTNLDSTGICITIIDLVVPVNLFGVDTCLVLPLTHVMVVVIPVHQVKSVVVPTQKMLLWNVVSDNQLTINLCNYDKEVLFSQ